MSKSTIFGPAGIVIRDDNPERADPIVRTITPDDLLRLVAMLDEPLTAQQTFVPKSREAEAERPVDWAADVPGYPLLYEDLGRHICAKENHCCAIWGPKLGDRRSFFAAEFSTLSLESQQQANDYCEARLAAESKPTTPAAPVPPDLPEGCKEVPGYPWLCKDADGDTMTRETSIDDDGGPFRLCVWKADSDSFGAFVYELSEEFSATSRNEVHRFLAAQAARKAAAKPEPKESFMDSIKRTLTEAAIKQEADPRPEPLPPPKVLTPDEAEKLDDHTLYAVWFKAQFRGMRLSEGYLGEIKQCMSDGIAYILVSDHHTYGDVRKAFDRHFAAKGGEK